MKKSIICLAALLCIALGFTGCEKESEGLTNITYFAEIILEGDDYMVVAKGSTFVDPGFTASMKGEDVTDKVEVSSDVDTSVSGIYTITYSIVNADGFPASASRTVVVLDASDPVEGMWKLDQANSQRIYNGGAPAAYKGAFEFLIIKQDDGTYYVEDLMAGWYAQGAGYGSAYAMEAIIDIADDGTISLLASQVPGWGDSADGLTDGLYDAATNTITYKLFYAEVIEFDVTINKVDLGL
ncbi:MAG: DUF5012 domain-containing protein [Paludibacteraceae bacterium]|nr:DUF5012 domain-containing protein [Paludibacteraceae bacterium]